MFNTRYRKFCDVLEQVSRQKNAPAFQLMPPSPSSDSSIATSTSSATSTSTSVFNSTYFLSSTSTYDTLPITTPSSSVPSIGSSDLLGPLITDLIDTATAVATVAASPSVLPASPASTLALGSASTLSSTPAAVTAPTPAAALAPVVTHVLPAAAANHQLFLYGDTPIRLPLETLELVLDSISGLKELLVIATSTHGLRAAASRNVRTVHLQNATLDARTWLRAANVAYPRSCKAIRGRSMSLVIDLEGEKDVDVRLEAQRELERLLPFIEVLRLLSSHCALLPTLFDAPAPLLRELDLGNGSMPLVHAPGPIFGGSGGRLTTLAVSATGLRAALAHPSFKDNTPGLRNVRVYPDPEGAVRTTALQEAVCSHALNVVDDRWAPDLRGSVDFAIQFETSVVKLNMRCLAAFSDIALRLTVTSIAGVTDHLVLAGAGAGSQTVIAALSFLDYETDAIVFCGILAIGDKFQLTLRTESGCSCSITALSEDDLVALLVDHLGALSIFILRGVRTVVFPLRTSAGVLSGIFQVIVSVPPAVDVVFVATPLSPLVTAEEFLLPNPVLPGYIRGNLKIVGFRFRERGDADDTEDQPFDSEGAQMPVENGKDLQLRFVWSDFLAAVELWRPASNEITVCGVKFDDAPDGQLFTDNGIRVIRETTPWTV